MIDEQDTKYSSACMYRRRGPGTPGPEAKLLTPLTLTSFIIDNKIHLTIH